MKAISQLTLLLTLVLSGKSFAFEMTTSLENCRAYQVVEPRFGTRDWVDVDIVEQSPTTIKDCPSFVMIDSANVYSLTTIGLRRCNYEYKSFELYCEKVVRYLR